MTKEQKAYIVNDMWIMYCQYIAGKCQRLQADEPNKEEIADIYRRLNNKVLDALMELKKELEEE